MKRNISIWSLFLILVVNCQISGCTTIESKLNKPDLSPLKKINKAIGEPIQLIKNGKLTMPIVIGPAPRVRWGAEFLADVVDEMTGNKPMIIVEKEKITGPGIYIGNLNATKKAGFSSENMKPGEFAVKTKNGSIYLFGNDKVKNSFGSSYAVYDFCERVLDARQYFDPKKGGRSVIKTNNLTIDPLDYSDAPMFEKREIWPYTGRRDLETWRSADTYPNKVMCHEPRNWCKDPDYRKNRPEIFQLEKDGKRGKGPMLCYGHPKTLETYLERIDEELKGGRKSDVLNGKTVTVSPWDGQIACHCEYCKKLFDPEAGASGSSSKILYSFVRKLSDALAKKHPDLVVGYLPYLNYCDVPKGATFPAGNVQVQLCSMPGLAMFKEPAVKAREERLIRDWAKATGRKIQNWHYICWPAEFTKAPYLYPDTVAQHYKDTKDLTVGSFINGWFNPEERHFLSAYIWVRLLWNINLDTNAVLDEFCRRMFKPAAKPMRQIMLMQEDGWKRPWKIANLSPKNIYEISYPRKDVLKMEKLFQQAYQLAGDDPLLKKRLDYYKKGFDEFFKVSKEHAEGTAFTPLMIQKVGANPVIDGKLDDIEWKQADGLGFVRALDKKKKSPKYPTKVKAVWTPDGVTFGFKMTEPTPEKLYTKDPAGEPESWGNDNIELIFDVTGKGEGDYFHIIFDARDEEMFTKRSTEKAKWQFKNIKKKIYRGDDFWSCEIFIPFSEFKGVRNAQIPKTSSSGLFWIGNFSRHRVTDTKDKDKRPGSEKEMQRLNTRYSAWNADQSAFGILKFKE